MINWNYIENKMEKYMASAKNDKIPRVPEIVAFNLEKIYLDEIKRSATDKFGNKILSIPTGFLASSLKKSFEYSKDKYKLPQIKIPEISIEDIKSKLPTIKLPPIILPYGQVLNLQIPKIDGLDIQYVKSIFMSKISNLELNIPKVNLIKLQNDANQAISGITTEQLKKIKSLLEKIKMPNPDYNLIIKELPSLRIDASVLNEIKIPTIDEILLKLKDRGIDISQFDGMTNINQILDKLRQLNTNLLQFPEFDYISKFQSKITELLSQKLKIPNLSLKELGIEIPTFDDIGLQKFNVKSLLGLKLAWNPAFVTLGQTIPPPGTNFVTSNKIVYSGTFPTMNIIPEKQNMISEIVKALKYHTSTIQGTLIAATGPQNIPVPFNWTGIS